MGVDNLLVGMVEEGLEGNGTKADDGKGGSSIAEGGELGEEGGVVCEDLGLHTLLKIRCHGILP